MSKKTTSNYTDEQVNELRNVYTAAETDEERKAAVSQLAESQGRSEASIRAKLVNMGIYQKAERTDKAGNKSEQKDEIVSDIAELCGKSVEAFDSLEKANKSVLKNLRERLNSSEKAES